ncbi:MAG: NUDIX hydrolase [Candidatus Woesearchaeota archaeon]|nr:MAG: NUDIX hydrolase [Candidatus Woesearchaeota archaeon]
MVKYFVHKDGRIYLVKKNDKFCLPSKEEIPFEIEIKNKINCKGDVYFCSPKIDYFPEDWPHNDELIIRDDVDKEVKEAFFYSLCRPVVGGIILNDKNEVLMVYGNRGLSKGFWNAPGGFVEFGEDPAESIVREVFEEIGYKVSVDRLFGVYSKIYERNTPGYYMIGIFYVLKIEDKSSNIDETEINKVKFMPIEEAIEKTKNRFVKIAFKDLLKEL